MWELFGSCMELIDIKEWIGNKGDANNDTIWIGSLIVSKFINRN